MDYDFKIGDVVRIKNNHGDKGHKLVAGESYVINHLYPGPPISARLVGLDHKCGCHTCDEQGHCGGWFSNRFERVETNPCSEVELGTHERKKCGCPIDVLMNEGCKCGGK